MEAEGSPETLENLVRVTQNQESIFQAYYTNDSGEVVTMSVYDISTTDPGPEYLFNIFSCSLKKSSHERNWDQKKAEQSFQNFNSWMIKLTKTPILPNYQVTNGFYLYKCEFNHSRIEVLQN